MITITGKSVFGGVSIGKLSFYKRNQKVIKREHVENVESECVRFQEAKAEGIRQLKELYEKSIADVGEANAMIFEIHQMMLEDLDYIESVSYTHLDVYKRQIMESVRKGKGLKPEWEEAMKEKDVPDWYIWSCKQISYMFPKAHAAAYVMMAYRIAYCKINYPLAYYGAYFGIRANAFSYELMCQGKDKLNYYMKDYKRRSDSLSNKEQDVLKDMKIVQEMYARGYEFLPLDIYKAKATKFQIKMCIRDRCLRWKLRLR